MSTNTSWSEIIWSGINCCLQSQEWTLMLEICIYCLQTCVNIKRKLIIYGRVFLMIFLSFFVSSFLPFRRFWGHFLQNRWNSSTTTLDFMESGYKTLTVLEFFSPFSSPSSSLFFLPPFLLSQLCLLSLSLLWQCSQHHDWVDCYDSWDRWLVFSLAARENAPEGRSGLVCVLVCMRTLCSLFSVIRW